MSKKRILLVDDERDLVETMVMKFEALGFEVVTAYDGAAGLDKARKENVDIIILDLMLPKMDGYKVCGLLKKDARYADIPIILLSAKAQETDIKMGEEAGADAYITKPFDSKVLLAKINELISAKE